VATKRKRAKKREPVAEDYPIANPEDYKLGRLFVISFGA
jgi:hypothetical protein